MSSIKEFMPRYAFVTANEMMISEGFCWKGNGYRWKRSKAFPREKANGAERVSSIQDVPSRSLWSREWYQSLVSAMYQDEA